jgi:hypothetical protein
MGFQSSQDNNARCAPVAHRCTVATLLYICHTQIRACGRDPPRALRALHTIEVPDLYANSF